jgi:hypothetical protein
MAAATPTAPKPPQAAQGRRFRPDVSGSTKECLTCVTMNHHPTSPPCWCWPVR